MVRVEGVDGSFWFVGLLIIIVLTLILNLNLVLSIVGFPWSLLFVWCSGSLLAYATLLSVAAVFYSPDEDIPTIPPQVKR